MDRLPTSVEDAAKATLTPTVLPVGKTLALSARWDDTNWNHRHIDKAMNENGWKATIDNLPKYKNGKQIVYTWTEPELLCYMQTSVVINGTTTTFTNTIPGQPVRTETPAPALGVSEINHVGDCFD